MAKLDVDFVDSAFWKTILLGCISAAAGALLISLDFAGAVLLGMLVSAFNLRVVGWVSRKMVGSAQKGRTSSAIWSIILVVKLLLLFVLTYVFIIVLKANVIGFIIGFSVFLVALTWQSILYLSQLEKEEDQEDKDDQDTSDLQDPDTQRR